MHKNIFPVMLLLSFAIANANTVHIDLKKQTLKVISNKGDTVLVTEISSGNSLHPTPRGKFKIFAKERYHKSTLYPIRENGERGGANMDYMLKFAPSIAIHKGNVVYEEGHSVPASHGCIRTPEEKAKKLFALIGKGDTVIVEGKPNFKNKFEKKIIKRKEKWDREYIEVEPSPTNIVFDFKDFDYIGRL